MNRRAMLGLLAAAPFAGSAQERRPTVCTEVKHGPNPQWEAKTYGEYSCRLVGHYTDTHDLTACGVREWKWNSDRPAKQMPELLGMRTAFLEWFMETYQKLGGSRAEAIGQVQFIVDMWRLNKKCVVTATGWEVR